MLARRTHKFLSAVLTLALLLGLAAPGALATEGEYTCGKQEHTHTEACYETVHTHDETCYEVVQIAHEHTDACYTETAGHEHTDACYTQTPGHEHTDTCYTETQGHTHTDACHDPETGDLTCTESTEPVRTLTCTESTEPVRTLTCTESTEPVRELTCTKEFDEQQTLICTQEEQTLICELEEHIHTEACLQSGVTCEHEYVVDEQQSTATCMHSGTVVSVCSNCGDVQTETDAFIQGHEEQWQEQVVVPVTCLEDGVSDFYCPICDDTWEDKTVKATGHAFENGICTKCGASSVSPGSTFVVDDCWAQDGQPSFDGRHTLTCEVLTAPEGGEPGTAAVIGWSGVEGNTKTIYILIPETVTDDMGNVFTITEVTANFQMNQANSAKGKLGGVYIYAPITELSVNSMFSGQSSMTVLRLPSTLKVIDTGCFNGCKKLSNVVLPEGLEEIGIGAFEGAFSIKQETLDIPASVTKIGSGAFAKTRMKTVTGGAGVTSLDSRMFQNCNNLTSVEFPNVTSIESSAFQYASSLTTVGWDWSQVTEVGECAFQSTAVQGELDLASIQSMGEGAFQNSYRLAGVTVGDGLTAIPKYAFYGCAGLTEVVLPNSVQRIEEGAFGYAGDGNPVTVTVGSGEGSRLNFVGTGAFADCAASITVETSQDNITGAANLGEQVTYTVASLETIGDAAALQALIDAAAATPDAGDDVLALQGSYLIDKTVTIPDGADITLTSALADGVTLKAGSGLNGAMLSVAGGLTLEDGVTVRGLATSASTGAVDVTGSFTMNGGAVSNNVLGGSYSAAVRLNEGAQMTMNGGSISDNEAGQQYSAGGVLVLEGASFVMEDGLISNNKGHRGAGVLLYGGVTNEGDNLARFTMRGGEISGNETTGYLNVGGVSLNPGGGGVYVHNDAEFIMEAGVISGNHTSMGQGGGVATEAWYPERAGGIFTMYGGTITGNSASNGGGIYSYSNSVTLYAGEITYNTATSLGGGMYVSIQGRSIRLEGAALITGNTAGVMGGGVWSCPTGTMVLPNSAVFGNTAEGAGDDVAALRKTTGIETTLSGGLPGGGVAGWYADGGTTINALNNSEQGSVSDAPRYQSGDPRVDVPEQNTASFTAKAIVTDDSAELAQAAAVLIITGNHAARGGGIGSNGTVTQSGGPDTGAGQLSVEKRWSGADSNQPDSVTVELTMTVDGEKSVIDTVRLSADNDWQHTFTYVSREGAVYGVEEVVPANYTSAVSGNAEDGFVITNTYQTSVTPDPDPDPKPDPDPDPDPEPTPPETDEQPNDETDIPEETTPLDPGPSPEPGVTPDTEIPEEGTPLDPGPGEGGDPDVTIDEDDVPLGELPQTGFVAQAVEPGVTLGMAALAFSLAGAGLMASIGRRKKDGED